MAVCTNDVTRGYLVEYRLPFPVAQVCGDIEVLVPAMIELQEKRVGLAAVNAGPRAQEVDEIRRPFRDERPFSLHRARDITLVVQYVVLPFVGGSAGAAVVVALTARLPAPGKVQGGFELPAASALPGRVDLDTHERMFPSQPDGYYD